MPAPVQEWTNEIRTTVGVMASAAVLIRGFRARIQAAVDAAIANGATAEELAPVQAEVDNLKTGETDLSAAVAENA